MTFQQNSKFEERLFTSKKLDPTITMKKKFHSVARPCSKKAVPDPASETKTTGTRPIVSATFAVRLETNGRNLSEMSLGSKYLSWAGIAAVVTVSRRV